MNEENELEKLVIKNLEIVEQSRKLLEDTVEPEFKKKLLNLLEGQLRQILPGWYVYSDKLIGANVLTIDKKSWCFDKSWCTFSIGFDSGKWRTSSYIAALSNVGNTGPKIIFESDDGFNKKFNVDFRSEAQHLYLTHKERLDAAGFQIEDNKLYVPFQLDHEKISAEWPHLTADSIKPLLDALQSVSQVTDIFDDLVKRLTGQNKSSC